MYREYRPPGMDDFVDCVWTSTRVGAQRVVPDGCMDVIWDGQELIIAGPDTAAHVAQGSGRLVAVRFQPGVAPGMLGVPADAVRDVRVPLSEVWAADRVERLAERLNIARPGHVLLSAVTHGEPDAFAGAVRRLAAQSGDITAMADKLGYSERQLRRRCLALFGYGPKVLYRVLRFNHALSLAYQGTEFAEVAQHAGYADQAHLSREVKDLAGVPLGALVRTPT
jgi:AraC-like DNA-binding protein